MIVTQVVWHVALSAVFICRHDTEDVAQPGADSLGSINQNVTYSSVICISQHGRCELRSVSGML